MEKSKFGRNRVIIIINNDKLEITETILKNYEKLPLGNYQDLLGLVFQKLTVVNYFGKIKGTSPLWIVECNCKFKTNFVVIGYSLTNKLTTNCGCIKYIKGQLIKKYPSEYKSWDAMKQRCNNSNDKDYHNYGERGITICDEWLDNEIGFENFINDMGSKPTYEFSIERRDFNGNYDPFNCKWIHSKEQPRNRRSNVIKNINEAEEIRKLSNQFTQKELAKKYNINISNISRILNNKRWSTDLLS